jgi:hypothetical protein
VSGRECAVTQCTDELVSSEADESVVGAQVLLDGARNVPQQHIARSMALMIVDLLEVVHVDVSKHQAAVSAASPDDLSLEDDEPDPPPKRSGKWIELGVSELGPHILLVATGGDSIGDGVPAVSRRMLPVGSCATPVRSPLLSFCVGQIPIRGREFSIRSG